LQAVRVHLRADGRAWPRVSACHGSLLRHASPGTGPASFAPAGRRHWARDLRKATAANVTTGGRSRYVAARSPPE
jgi:hypothetical protein